MTLNDKRIIILGGTSGIGLAVAQAAAAEGARVLVASSDPARVEQALAVLPAGAEGLSLDLLDDKSVEAFFAATGSLDHLVYTAGETLKLAMTEEVDLATARRFFELRYWGAFTVAKFAAGRIRPGGSIVFTSG